MKKRFFPLSLTILVPVLFGVLLVQTGAFALAYFSVKQADFNDTAAVDQTQLMASKWMVPKSANELCAKIKEVYEANPRESWPATPEEVKEYQTLYQPVIKSEVFDSFVHSFPTSLLGSYTEYISIGFFDVPKNRFVTAYSYNGGSILNVSFPGSFDTFDPGPIRQDGMFLGVEWFDQKRQKDYFVSGVTSNLSDPMSGWWIVRHATLDDVYSESTEFRNSFVWVAVATFGAMAALSFVGIRFGLIRPIKRLSNASDRYVNALHDGQLLDETFSLDKKRHRNEITTLNDSLHYMQDAMKDYAGQVREAATREQKAAADLAIAERIQASMVPGAMLLGKGCSFFGKMHPAKEVGGDFFSYFQIDDDRYGFYIADVSGKGVPAALFMARAATVSRLLIGNLDIEQINDVLSEENGEELFVTGFFGLVDEKQHKLHYVNCGHEPVYFRHNGVYAPLEEKPNLPLGLLGGFAFQKQSIDLVEGDALFLYTDGLSEAMNKEGELFGKEAILETLNENPLLTGEELFTAMDAKMSAFVNGAEQSDDTCFLHFEVANQAAITFEPTLKGLAKMGEFVEETLSPHFDLSLIAPLGVVLDEFASNIVNYSGATEASLHLSYGPRSVRIVLSDNGTPFDPTTAKVHKGPDEPGGFGIMLASKYSSSVRYRRAEGKNLLSFEIQAKKEEA